jgi:hypothetical protein
MDRRSDAQAMLLPLRQEEQIVKIEKNLNSFGFFSPSHKGLDTKKTKTISVVREDRGHRIHAKATIFPSPEHGLPTTADQDKYFAFQKIVTEIKKRTGVVSNPIGFTSYQLLKILGITPSGKNYEDVAHWLERMTLTGIRSENIVFLADQKIWAKDIFHVFDRVVIVGQEMPNGRLADQNYVWLSQWQLENLNSNYVLPVDLHTYRQLRSTISKALVPLLQIWFYASQRKQIEKRYSDLCQHLNCRRWVHLSKITANFAPALRELQSVGFLESWTIEPTTDNSDFKILLVPGERYFRDGRLRPNKPTPLIPDEQYNVLLEALIVRGVREDRARHILAEEPHAANLAAQIEWSDYLIRCGRKQNFFNPAGFLVYLIENKITPPAQFETSQKILPVQKNAQTADNTNLLQQQYTEYQQQQISAYMAEAINEQELAGRVKNARMALRKQFKSADLWPEEEQNRVALQMVKQALADEAPMLTIEEFQNVNKQAALFATTAKSGAQA